jgi:hypothetical protein
MNAWTWKECCAEAIKSICDCGITYVSNEEIIELLGKTRGYMLAYYHQALEAEDGREEFKSLSKMKKFRKSTDPTGMHLPFLVNSSHR